MRFGSKYLLFVTVVVASFVAVHVGHASQSSLGGSLLSGARSALIDVDRPAQALLAPVQTATLDPSAGASLFAGRQGSSLFSLTSRSGTNLEPIRHSGIAGLRTLIASAEAGKAGYDAVQHGAKIKTPKPPTRMTLGEIYAWIDETPGQPHAIGRYQMIPPTLRRVMDTLGVGEDTLFSPRIQDLAADVLLEEAGLSAFLRSDLSQKDFLNNLAKIWAGLPNHKGKSHYHGYAGNKAVITRAYFEEEIERIFPRG